MTVRVCRPLWRVPANVGSVGGVQPLGVLRSDMSGYEAVNRINEAIMSMEYDRLYQKSLSYRPFRK
ncbi:hypothetical protein ES705_24244 [subsurface metagenome]